MNQQPISYGPRYPDGRLYDCHYLYSQRADGTWATDPEKLAKYTIPVRLASVRAFDSMPASLRKRSRDEDEQALLEMIARYCLGRGKGSSNKRSEIIEPEEQEETEEMDAIDRRAHRTVWGRSENADAKRLRGVDSADTNEKLNTRYRRLHGRRHESSTKIEVGACSIGDLVQPASGRGGVRAFDSSNTDVDLLTALQLNSLVSFPSHFGRGR